MTPIDLDDLGRLLVEYIAEHTGLQRPIIEMILDAQTRFWEERPHLMHDFSDDTDEGGEA